MLPMIPSSHGDIPEPNYQAKADAACVLGFHDCMRSSGCILSDKLCVI